MDVIEKWFKNGCDYKDGVAIYETLPQRSVSIVRVLRLRENPANIEKLKYELGKHRAVASTPAIIKKPTVVVTATAEAVEKKQTLLFHQLPPELRPELFKANELFRKNCFLKVELNELPDAAEKEALQMILQIDQNQKENALCWKKIDYWLDHRQLPKEVTLGLEKLTAAQLVKRQQYLFVQISKMKRRFEQNSQLLTTVEDVTEKSRLQRLVAKQNGDLIKKNEELQIITKLINGK